MINLEMLRECKRFLKALGVTVPEIEELERMEKLARKERLNESQYTELMALMEKHRGVICGDC